MLKISAAAWESTSEPEDDRRRRELADERMAALALYGPQTRGGAVTVHTKAERRLHVVRRLAGEA